MASGIVDTPVAAEGSGGLPMTDDAGSVADKIEPEPADLGFTQPTAVFEPSKDTDGPFNHSDGGAVATAPAPMPASVDGRAAPQTTPTDSTDGSDAKEATLTEFELQVMSEANSLKTDGNRHFKERAFEAAASCYYAAVEKVEALRPEAHAQSSLPIYLSNLAFCNIKLENYGFALLEAGRAIELNPKFAKAYYRRGAAFVALTKFQLALNDFQAAYQLQPDPETRSRIKECKKELRQIKFAEAISSEPVKPLSQTINLEHLESTLATYTGPRYSRTPQFLKELIEYIKVPENLLHKRDVYQMVLDNIQILSKLPTLVPIELDSAKEITICGDIHGQFYDLLNIFELNGLPSDSNPYIFNGDFVDRGSFSVECILTLFTAKLIYPDSVHLARGNHETRNMNKLYGFQGEVTAKYDATLYQLFCEAFCHLPLAHLINNKVFLVHGGLFSKDGVTLADIAGINRNMEPADDGLMAELLWSDPQPEIGRSPSRRGVACAFGPDVTSRFLKENNLKCVVRSHEVKDEGYEVTHDGKLITVFSAPNYCDQMGNKGAFIRMRGDTLEPHFFSFSCVPHPAVQPMRFASPLLGLLG